MMATNKLFHSFHYRGTTYSEWPGSPDMRSCWHDFHSWTTVSGTNQSINQE